MALHILRIIRTIIQSAVFFSSQTNDLRLRVRQKMQIDIVVQRKSSTGSLQIYSSINKKTRKQHESSKQDGGNLAKEKKEKLAAFGEKKTVLAAIKQNEKKKKKKIYPRMHE